MPAESASIPGCREKIRSAAGPRSRFCLHTKSTPEPVDAAKVESADVLKLRKRVTQIEFAGDQLRVTAEVLASQFLPVALDERDKIAPKRAHALQVGPEREPDAQGGEEFFHAGDFPIGPLAPPWGAAYTPPRTS